ncbi:MAG: transporter substrate-binding domain-containing protein [Spirochaetia bacterium]
MPKNVSVTAAAVIFCFISLHQGVCQEILQPDSSFTAQHTLTIGCDHDYPPLSYKDKNGKIKGFDTDLVKRIGINGRLSVEINAGPWADVLEMLERGKIDAVSGILRTQDRSRKFDFSIPYFVDYFALYVRKGSDIKNIADIKDKRLVILENDAAIEKIILPNQLDDNMVTVPSFTEAFNQIEDKKADYTIAPFSLGKSMLRQWGFSGIKAIDHPILPIEYRFAVKRGNRGLLSLLNEEIHELAVTGVIGDLSDEYRFLNQFSQSSSASDSSIFLIIAAIGAATAAAVLLAIQLISYLKKLKRIRASHIRLNTVIDALPFPLYWKNTGSEIIGGNRHYRENVDIHGDNPDDQKKRDNEVLERGEKQVHYRQKKDQFGREILVRLTRVPIVKDDVVTGILTYEEDITEEAMLKMNISEMTEELIKKEKTIQELSVMDPQLACFNRKAIIERFREEMALSSRYDHITSAITVKITNCEEVIHHHGYDGMDSAVLDFIQGLKNTIRTVDILGRLSDNSFLIIFPHTKPEDCEVIAAKLSSIFSTGDYGSRRIPLLIKFMTAEKEDLDNLLTSLDGYQKDQEITADRF